LGYLGSAVQECKVATYQAANAWWAEQLSAIEAGRHIPSSRSARQIAVGELAEAWLDDGVALARAGGITAGEISNRRYHLKRFREWIGERMPVAAIDEGRWHAFCRHLLDEVARGEISRSYAGRIVVTLRQWLRHLDRLGLVREPKNLRDRLVPIDPAPGPVLTLDPADIRRAVQAATGQLRLHLLLMANCGLTQKDISDLAPGEVEWVGQAIVRARSKTRGRGGVPIVRYPLWPSTFQLLSQWRSSDQARLLVTRTGGPWVDKSIQANGRAKNSDHIRTNWHRIAAKLGVDWPLKRIRKTSATLLASHPVYGRFDWLFLGHSPATIKDRHYVAPDPDLFAAAVRWLGERYELLDPAGIGA
jgi:integrase